MKRHNQILLTLKNWKVMHVRGFFYWNANICNFCQIFWFLFFKQAIFLKVVRFAHSFVIDWLASTPLAFKGSIFAEAEKGWKNSIKPTQDLNMKQIGSKPTQDLFKAYLKWGNPIGSVVFEIFSIGQKTILL